MRALLRLVPWELRIVNANAVLLQGYLQGYSMRIAKASVNGALQQGYVVAQQCLCKAAEQQQQQQQSALLYVVLRTKVAGICSKAKGNTLILLQKSCTGWFHLK